jgi:hypothetical protein
MIKKIAVSTLALAIGAGFGAAQAQDNPCNTPDNPEEMFLTIGTGGVTGVYYPTGGAIQRLVNAGRDDHGIRVSVESTGGSVFNLNAIQAGELDMGVVQSDWQFHSYNGSHDNFPEANEDLRAVFAVHPEPLTIVARNDSGVTSLSDIPGTRVNVGNPGSGARATFEVLMDAMGWSMDDFSQTSELATAEQSQALCDNNFDVMPFVVGHPSGTIQEATTLCDTTIVAADGPEVEALIDENPYYSWATVPGGMYAGNPDDVRTFGVRATFVTSADVPDYAVCEVVRAVFENFDTFRRLHPAFANLEPNDMVDGGLSAPIHAGGMSYYDAAGMDVPDRLRM